MNILAGRGSMIGLRGENVPNSRRVDRDDSRKKGIRAEETNTGMRRRYSGGLEERGGTWSGFILIIISWLGGGASSRSRVGKRRRPLVGGGKNHGRKGMRKKDSLSKEKALILPGK